MREGKLSRMGLFDSWCPISGLSLAPLEIAWVPLEAERDAAAGPAVFGRSNRAGSITPPTPSALRSVLVARGVYEALVAQGTDLASFGPFGPTHDGGQHQEGDLFSRHVDAVHRFESLPWMLEAIERCALEAEAGVRAMRSHEAPPAGWLQHATDGYYGVVVGEERREHPLHVHRVERGHRTIIDVSDAVIMTAGDQRLPLSAGTACDRLWLIDDPSFEVDRERLAALVTPITGPMASHFQTVWFGGPRGARAEWARKSEQRQGIFKFATVYADGLPPLLRE